MARRSPGRQLSNDRSALLARGDLYARRGQWRDAAADLDKAIELDPSDYRTWYCCGYLHAQLGDQARHTKFCRELLAQFGQTGDPVAAEWSAKVCLVVPDAVQDRILPASMAERALASSPDSPWIQFAKGLAEYREGQYAGAIQWLKKSQQSDRGGGEELLTQSSLVLAMAQHQSGEMAAARQSLRSACGIIDTRLLGIDPDDLGPGWHEWLACLMFRREAESLLKATMPSSAKRAGP
jgi:tetratricopeptide (TPR) repeat protein